MFSVPPQVLIDAGLISGRDLTPEAALSKLSYVLAKKDADLATKKKVGGPDTHISPQNLQDLFRKKEKKKDIWVFVCMCVCVVQLMAQNLRGEMSCDFAGTKLCLSDSRFIQVIAKSLSISCKEVRGQKKMKKKSSGSPRCSVSASERIFPFKPRV